MNFTVDFAESIRCCLADQSLLFPKFVFEEETHTHTLTHTRKHTTKNFLFLYISAAAI